MIEPYIDVGKSHCSVEQWDFSTSIIKKQNDLLPRELTQSKIFCITCLTNILTAPKGLASFRVIRFLALWCGVYDGKNGKRSMFMAFCSLVPTGERITIIWFNMYVRNKVEFYQGRNVLVAGKLKYNEDYNNYSMGEPLVFDGNLSGAFRMVPVYSEIRGMSDSYLKERMRSTLDHLDLVEEVILEEVVGKLGMLSEQEALYQMHHPDSKEMLYRAEIRLILNDLLYFALKTEWAFRRECHLRFRRRYTDAGAL